MIMESNRFTANPVYYLKHKVAPQTRAISSTIITSTTVMMLWEERHFHVADQVSKYIHFQPFFALSTLPSPGKSKWKA